MTSRVRGSMRPSVRLYSTPTFETPTSTRTCVCACACSQNLIVKSLCRYSSLLLSPLLHVPIVHPCHAWILEVKVHTQLVGLTQVRERGRIPTSSVVHWSRMWSISSSTCLRLLSAWDKLRHRSFSAPAMGYSNITLACGTHTPTLDNPTPHSFMSIYPQPQQHRVSGRHLCTGIHSLREHEVTCVRVRAGLGGVEHCCYYNSTSFTYCRPA